jgi:hypothetical protein
MQLLKAKSKERRHIIAKLKAKVNDHILQCNVRVAYFTIRIEVEIEVEEEGEDGASGFTKGEDTTETWEKLQILYLPLR